MAPAPYCRVAAIRAANAFVDVRLLGIDPSAFNVLGLPAFIAHIAVVFHASGVPELWIGPSRG